MSCVGGGRVRPRSVPLRPFACEPELAVGRFGAFEAPAFAFVEFTAAGETDAAAEEVVSAVGGFFGSCSLAGGFDRPSTFDICFRPFKCCKRWAAPLNEQLQRSQYRSGRAGGGGIATPPAVLAAAFADATGSEFMTSPLLLLPIPVPVPAVTDLLFAAPTEGAIGAVGPAVTAAVAVVVGVASV